MQKNNIIDFKPSSHLEAIANLNGFIEWAKNTLPKGVAEGRVYPGIKWEMDSWHSLGVNGCSFVSYHSSKRTKKSEKIYMQSPYVDFVRALIVHRTIFRRLKSVSGILMVVRVLEVSLYELTKTNDITRVSAAVLNRACELFQEDYSNKKTVYVMSKYLEDILLLMKDKGLLQKSFDWVSPLRPEKTETLKKQRENRRKKLPSPESIKALGEMFNNDLDSSLDIITLSACAFLLSQPSRIGELVDVEHDCILYKDSPKTGQRMFLRWYSEKGFGATVKPVIPGMESVITRAIDLLTPITEEARNYAAWLEDHPDDFPPHADVPLKGLDEPLTYDEACSALKTVVHPNHSSRRTFKVNWLDSLIKRKTLSPKARKIIQEIKQGWDRSRGRRVYYDRYHHYYEYDDKVAITLRKLNVLVREKYLPKSFPYTSQAEDGKDRIKYRDALFTVRTGSLPDETLNTGIMQYDFGVEIGANSLRISGQLGGSQRRQSIFQRHGYGDLKVNTHAFRHELNTQMHRAGLSQLLIDAFSGRTSRGSVYNHETVEEKTQVVAEYHPATRLDNVNKCLDKVKTNAPLKLSDLTELHEGEQDLVIHKTSLGLCFHRFESEPCPKLGSCLTCGKLACVKGDDVRLANLREERLYLKERYEKALAAERRGDFGAATWRKKTGMDLFKCDALIKTIENPGLENGDMVWNSDNGWSLTSIAFSSLQALDEPQITEPIQQESLPSMDELAAILESIEV